MTTLEQEARRNERNGLTTAVAVIGFGLAVVGVVYLIDATIVPGFAAFVRCTLTARADALCPLP